MSFPKQAERKQCWDSRDQFWDCLDKNNGDKELCKKFQEAYMSDCPPAWVKHFDRRYQYLKFKEKMEKDNFDPVDEKKT